MGDKSAQPQQPYYIASVGKLYTSVLISLLYEKDKLLYEDKINQYLDQKLLENLHVYKGENYTDQIKISHLLNHTSGLDDNFWPLLEEVLEDPDFNMSPREAIIWGKNNLKPHFPPGKKFNYADANYHLLGLIIEGITEMSFHEALKSYIFEPFNLLHSHMLHYSESIEKPKYPMADFYVKDKKLTNHPGYVKIDYAAGGIVATSKDQLKFMKALVEGKIIRKNTLEKMMEDTAKFTLGIDYGYGIHLIRTIPIIMPKKLNSWGHFGATGAFMFYHPQMEAYVIGSFNHFDYQRKGARFMLKVISQLTKI